jgi:glycosyltransferase involved in cell wall biosynthesis
VLSISVVTPSLNQGRFVERTIRSVLDQDYAPLEYVVCDGMSTDETASILERFADRLTVLREPDRGQADAVNKGLRALTGDVIGWLNSDDVYQPGALSTVVDFLTHHPQIDVVYGDANLIGADDAILGTYYTEPWNPARLAERCFLCQPAVFFRRRVVERFGLLNTDLHYCLDYDYWLRLAAGGAPFAYLPRTLAGSRLHPETKTLSARLPQHEELNRMLRQRFGRVPDSWLLNHAHTLVELRRVSSPRTVVPYALAVVFEVLRLSWTWNRSIPRSLLAIALGPIAAGTRRRLTQSRSAAKTRPAS